MRCSTENKTLGRPCAAFEKVLYRPCVLPVRHAPYTFRCATGCLGGGGGGQEEEEEEEGEEEQSL